MGDLAIFKQTAKPPIFPQAFHQNGLLQIHKERIPVPPGNTAEPFTLGEARGFRGKYIIVDWIQRDGSDVFTARLIGDADKSTEFRVSVLPWWFVALIFGGVFAALGFWTGIGWWALLFLLLPIGVIAWIVLAG